jgi:acyl carrier protein
VRPASVLDFDAFTQYLSDGLQLESGAFEADSRLVDDLGLDSFDLVELLTLVEELGVRFPDEVAVGLDTVGDVYREYAQRTARFTGG